MESTTGISETPSFDSHERVEIFGANVPFIEQTPSGELVRCDFHFKGNVSRLNDLLKRLFKDGDPIIIASGHVGGMRK